MAVVTAVSAVEEAPRPASRATAAALARSLWKPLALAVLATWLLIVGAHHEPWFDEAQAWLLARDSSLADLLLRRVRYEGSPGLWHAVLWLLIRAGLPYGAFYLVPCACAIAGAAVILWRSPFPPLLRVALVATYFPAYQYAIIARSYALDLILVPALAALFARRLERPWAYGALIGLLANCNAHSFVAAAVVGGEFALRLVLARPRRLATLGLPLALGLFAAWSSWQPVDNSYLLQDHRPMPIVAAIHFINEAFIDRLAIWVPAAPGSGATFAAFGVSLAILTIPLLLLWRRDTGPLGLALVGALVGFSAAIYSSRWHAGILFLCWVMLLWVAWDAMPSRPRRKGIVVASLAVLFGMQAMEAANSAIWDLRHPFSASPRAAETLKDWRAANPTGTIGGLGAKAFGVQPYFDGNIFANYRQGAASPSYMVWRVEDAWRFKPTRADEDRLIAGHYDLLLVASDQVDVPDLQARLAAAGYRQIATNPGTMNWKGSPREDDSLLFFTRDQVSRR